MIHHLPIRLTVSLAVALGLSVAAVSAAPSRAATDLIPAGMSGAGFLDIAAIRSSFGAILEEGRAAAFLDELVARGLPDLRKDLETVAIAFDMDDEGGKSANLTLDGSVDGGKIIQFLTALTSGQVSTEAYRGVMIHTVTPENSEENESFQVASHDESLTVVSVDERHAHTQTRPTLDVLAGRRESYGTANRIQLPAGFMLAVDVEVPASAREWLGGNPYLSPFAAIVRITGALKNTEGQKVRLDVTGRCETAPQAEAVKATLQAFRAQLLASGRLDEQTRKLLEEMDIFAREVEAGLSIEVPRETVEDILRNFVGGSEA